MSIIEANQQALSEVCARLKIIFAEREINIAETSTHKTPNDIARETEILLSLANNLDAFLSSSPAAFTCRGRTVRQLQALSK